MSVKDFALLLLLNIIWGTAFAISGYAMKCFSPFFLYAMRFLLVGLATVPFFKLPKQEIKNFIMLSFATAFCFAGVALGVKHLDSSLSAMMTRLDIVFTILFSAWIFKEKITKNNIFGMIVCFLGIYVISGSVKSFNLIYIFILILSSVASGFANIISKKIKTMGSLGLVSWNSLFTGLWLLLLALATESGGFIIENSVVDVKEIFSLLYLSLISSFLCYVILFYLLKKNDASKVMPFNFIRSIISIIAGYFILNEPVTWNKIFGCFLIISGVMISQFKGFKSKDDVMNSGNENLIDNVKK